MNWQLFHIIYSIAILPETHKHTPHTSNMNVFVYAMCIFYMNVWSIAKMN